MSKYQLTLEGANGRYGIVKVIGKGEFGEVYMAENMQTKAEVAIKQAIKSELEKVKKRQELFQTEKKIMEMIKNENVISLIDHIETREKHYLVMEYCNQGDLDSYCKELKKQNKKPLEEERAKEFLRQLLNGFKGLHELFVIHRDLKLKNILVNNGQLKIADFGLSKLGDVGVTHVGTPYTKAPEVFKGKGRMRYNNKADIWSLGVIFYQLLFDLKYPFNGQNEKDLFDNIDRFKDLNFNPKGVSVVITDEAKRILRRMLERDPNKRISWQELYNDPYLDIKTTDNVFDPQYQETMTKFQIIRQLQCKIQETLGNSDLLREQRVIVNFNLYYIQFILSKRVLHLSRILNQLILTIKAQKNSSKALLSFIKDQEDTQFVYNIYYENTKHNLEQFIANKTKLKQNYETDMVLELTQQKTNWETYTKIVMNYYYCLLEAAAIEENRYPIKAMSIYEHVLDVLRCLENDQAFEGEKLKQKSKSYTSEDIMMEEKQPQPYLGNQMVSTDSIILQMKQNIEELFFVILQDQDE